MKQLLLDIEEVLEDMFQSGFLSVQDHTIAAILELDEVSEQMGLHGAGEMLAEIGRLLKKRHHQIEFEAAPLLELTAKLYAYLEYCEEKLDYDSAVEQMDLTRIANETEERGRQDEYE